MARHAPCACRHCPKPSDVTESQLGHTVNVLAFVFAFLTSERPASKVDMVMLTLVTWDFHPGA